MSALAFQSTKRRSSSDVPRYGGRPAGHSSLETKCTESLAVNSLRGRFRANRAACCSEFRSESPRRAILRQPTLPSVWMSVTRRSTRRHRRRKGRDRPSETNGRVGFRPDCLRRTETRLWRLETRCTGVCLFD